MGLAQFTGSPFDRQPYVDAARLAGWSSGFGDSVWDTSVGGPSGPAASMPVFYYPRLDRVYANDRSASGANSYLHFDPLFLDATSPAAGHLTVGATHRTILVIGEWDVQANVQKIYGAVNSGNNSLTELDSAGANPSLTDLGTFPHHSSIDMKASTGISGVEGERASGLGSMVFFETAGFALQPRVSVRHSDLTLYAGVMARIDLSDGLSTIETAIPVGHSSSPSQFQLPPAQGFEFTFDWIQFIPDDDSVPAAPKGRLHLATTDSQGGNLRIDPIGAGSRIFVYVKQVDFNPFGVAASPGNPNRVHGREVLFSRYQLLEETPVGSGGIGEAPSTANAIHEGAPFFHPPSNTIKIVYNHDALSMVGDRTEVRHTTVPAFAVLSPPTQRNEVETAKVATFQVEASGDIGEPIPGFGVDWALSRVSTFREALDTTGLPSSSFVDNPPIDSEEDLVVELDTGGGPTTLIGGGDDYSVNLSTGEITWLNGTNGNHPVAESGYTATYRHSTTQATPPHGTLLTLLSKTDEDGVAVARVQYADDDDLVGQFDRLQADPS